MSAQGKPPPPYPPDLRANGWRFELDMARVRQSDTWLAAGNELRPWLLMLWATAWDQVPAGSLPIDDVAIAAHIGMKLAQFRQFKHVLLRGWRPHSDGRMYHPVVTEMVVRMAEGRRGGRERVAAWRQRQRAHSDLGDGASIEGNDAAEGDMGTEAVTCYVTHYGNATGNRKQETGNRKRDLATFTGCSSPAVASDLLGDPLPETPSTGKIHYLNGHRSEALQCPQAQIVALWGEVLPALPQPRAWRGQRVEHLCQRWREEATARDWKTQDEGVTWFRKLFAFVGQSRFLTGRVPPRDGRTTFVCELPWLVRPENFLKVSEGRYHPDDKD